MLTFGASGMNARSKFASFTNPSGATTMLRRPDVAVDDAVPVGVRQPAAHALDDLDFLGPGQRPLGVVAEQRFEASAFLDVLGRLDKGVVVPREDVAGMQQIRVPAQEARGVLAVEDLAQAVLLLLRR
jgi:hypothetical protein